MNEGEPLPPYMQVAGQIRSMIVRGELTAGDKVPSAREIASRWGVARATADKVLQALRAQGLVEVVGRTGTVVRANPPIYRSAEDRLTQVRQTGRIYTRGERAKIVATGTAPAPVEVADALQVAVGTPVIRRRRVTLLDETPLSSSTSWFTTEVGAAAPLLLAPERILEGTTKYVEQATGRIVRYAQERFSARLATAEEAFELAQPLPLAVLETRHTAWDSDDQPITFEVGLGRPGYEITRTIPVEPTLQTRSDET